MFPYTFNIVGFYKYYIDNVTCFKVWTCAGVVQAIHLKEISLSHMKIYLISSSYVKKHILDNVTESFIIIGNFMYCNVVFVLCSFYVKDSINRIIFITCFQVVNIMSLYFSQQKWRDYSDCMFALCTEWLHVHNIQVVNFLTGEGIF